MHRLLRFCACALATLPLHAATASNNMIGRQSHNEGVVAVPAPATVTIDGDLADWHWQGRIEVFAEQALRGRYSVEMAAMWDADHLYLGAKWYDPTPMFSMVNPSHNPDKGWMADAWQMRFLTDQTVHVSSWFFAEEQVPCLSVSYKKNGANPTGFRCKADGLAENGIRLAYKKGEDGRSFSQELAIPWSFLYQQTPTVAAGHTLRLGNEFLWGDSTGKTWPMHRYADNMQPGVTSREFYWQNTTAWGDLTLSDSTDVERRQYVSQSDRPTGPIPVRLTVPATAQRFTIAIDDANGTRIRNLAGDCNPQDYQVASDADTMTVEVEWDGRDDAGKLVEAGSYRIRGLTHTGIGAEYEYCYYNPGTPAWNTADGSGAWGADHANPCGLAATGEGMVVTWTVAEGGSGTIFLGDDDRKHWGEKRGARHAAVSGKHLFGLIVHGGDAPKLCRYDAKTGEYRPFQRDGQDLPVEVAINSLLPDTDASVTVTAMAANDQRLLVATDDGRLCSLDPISGKASQPLSPGRISALALAADDRCLAIIDGRLQAIDLQTGKTTALRAKGLDKPSCLALDRDGLILTFDAGADQQVKAFAANGSLAYTIGKRGGRPLRGRYEADGLQPISALAVDHRGRIWTVEQGGDPRRVSIWERDGSLARDFLGNTGYAGTGAYLNEDEPDHAYVGSLRFAIDRETRSYTLTDILWVPRPDHNEAFSLWSHPHHFSNPGFVQSAASGQRRSYLYHNGMYSQYQAIYMDRGGVWQPVAAICQLDYLRQQCPSLDLPKGDKKTMVFWNDTDKDGAVDATECSVASKPFSINAGWSHSAGSDLSIYSGGINRFTPIRFTDDGAPIYGDDSYQRLGDQKALGEVAPVDAEGRLVCAGRTNYPNPGRIFGMDLKTGTIQWTYPNLYPSVHGSHRATMPKPGLIIGPLKICGVVDAGEEAGQVFMMRGNLGQDFYLTTDGLYVGAMFSDTRLPGAELPAKEADLIGQPMEMFSHGGEPFNGWIGRQADGVVRMVCGLSRQAAMVTRINGLDSIRRTKPVSLEVTPAQIEAAASFTPAGGDDNGERAYTITRVSGSPMGKPDAWAAIPAFSASREGSGESASFTLAHDGSFLYWRSEVSDQSPWKNSGKDHTRFFKTGDCVDLQLSVQGDTKHKDPQAGDMRIVIAPTGSKPVAVLMQVKGHGPVKGERVTYQTGWSRVFDNVAILGRAQVKQTVSGNGYVIEAAIPLADLGCEVTAGRTILGDAGFISGDAAGMRNVARTYWANPATNLVNDEPQEAWLYPEHWGSFTFE